MTSDIAKPIAPRLRLVQIASSGAAVLHGLPELGRHVGRGGQGVATA